MVEINLNDAEFFAYHGYYPEEQLLGGRFMVNISVSFEPDADLGDDNIENTINYVQLYDIASVEMNHTRKLIETVAQAICDATKEKFPFLQIIKVCLKKMDPPLKGKVAHSSVMISYERK